MTQGTMASVGIVTAVPTVTQQVAVRPLAPAARGYLTRPDAEWSWADLRDFVIYEIWSRLPAGVELPRDATKESGIFKGFLARWPAPAGVLIARRAFAKPNDGWWEGSPIRVERFCAGSDRFFAHPLAEQVLAARAVQSSKADSNIA
jgi:hypothetical protein